MSWTGRIVSSEQPPTIAIAASTNAFATSGEDRGRKFILEFRISAVLLRGDHEVRAAILHVGVFRGTLVDRALFAEADRGDAVVGDTLVLEVVLGGIRALFAQSDVVLDPATLVAV